MPIAAVPDYIQKDDPELCLSTPPGHRFLLYFAAWGDNQETNKKDWGLKDRVPIMRRQQGQLVQQGWVTMCRTTNTHAPLRPARLQHSMKRDRSDLSPRPTLASSRGSH